LVALALVCDIAGTVFAIKTRCGEAFRVSFHDINCRALWLVWSFIATPITFIPIKGYEEDTGSTIATQITHINIKLQGTTQVLGLEGLICGVICFGEDEGTVVKTHLDLITVSA
jgi:hypothetical protein